MGQDDHNTNTAWPDYANRNPNTMMSIHLWDILPSREAHEIHGRDRFRDHVHDILVPGEPATKEYEVLALG